MVHSLTIFLSAFLLFLVQLIISKRILPWFGGTPAVWTTCMLFFQLLLLAGYSYAHFLTSRCSRTMQVRIHGILLATTLVWLSIAWWQWGTPILPDERWRPLTPDRPVQQILRLLGASVGLPFLVLASTSPLIQKWFSHTAAGNQTYRLYAVSNIGSMLALLGYPFLIEPWTAITTQAAGWGILYLLFIAGCFYCATLLPQAASKDKSTHLPVKGSHPKLLTLILWFILPMLTSAMLLSVTNNLCQDISIVPLLWIYPLTIYLLTFIICFDSPRWYVRRWFTIAGLASTIAVLITAAQGVELGILAHVISYGAFLFLFCMICHGELFALRPETGHLTLYYLLIAGGGAAGGIAIGMLAPLFLKNYWEFHIVLLFGWAAVTVVFTKDPASFFYKGERFCLPLLGFIAGYAVLRGIQIANLPVPAWFNHRPVLAPVIGALGFAVASCFAWNLKITCSKQLPRICMAAVLFFAEVFLFKGMYDARQSTVASDRNFYGVTRIEDRNIFSGRRKVAVRELLHGQITHGMQALRDPDLRQTAGAYYSPGSGIATAFLIHPRRTSDPGPLNIGVLGLGIGTIAAFAKPGDQLRFYEINPAVINYSTGPEPLFTYLNDCKGTVETISGDARLMLARELEAGSGNGFDILVMDAFSSGSVPAHLLTREAFEVYLRHLRDENSILAINISNRFLDFRDLMLGIAAEFNLNATIIDNDGDAPDYIASRWCLMTRSDRLRASGFDHETTSRPIVWTDDFSNVFQLLKQ